MNMRIIVLMVVSGVILTVSLSALEMIKLDRDPFLPVDRASLVLEALDEEGEVEDQGPYRIKLTGIIWDQQAPYAIVTFQGETRIIKPGDMMAGHHVELISKTFLRLKSDSKTLILEVGKEILL